MASLSTNSSNKIKVTVSGTSKLPPTERGPVAEKTGFAWTRSHECGTPAAGRGGTKAPAQLPRLHAYVAFAFLDVVLSLMGVQAL